MVSSVFLGWLVISPVLAVLIGAAARMRDVTQVPARAAEAVDPAEEAVEPAEEHPDLRAEAGSRLVRAAAGG